MCQGQRESGAVGGDANPPPHHHNNKIFNLNVSNIWNFSLFIKLNKT